MKYLGLAVAALSGIVGLVFVGTICSTALGCFTGWVVGQMWPDTMAIMLAKLGLADLQLWQFGAMLGFVGSFFRSSANRSASAD